MSCKNCGFKSCRCYESSKKYWKLVKALAKTEKDSDDLLMEEDEEWLRIEAELDRLEAKNEHVREHVRLVDMKW